MKREYFGMIFISVSLVIILTVSYFLGEEKLSEYLSNYIIVYLLVAFYAGQYSMKFPKNF